MSSAHRLKYYIIYIVSFYFVSFYFTYMILYTCQLTRHVLKRRSSQMYPPLIPHLLEDAVPVTMAQAIQTDGVTLR